MKRMTKIVVVALILISGAAFVFAGGQGEEGRPIKVGHLTYHSGAFVDVGPWFDGITEVALAEINLDPPLGRKLVAVHQDIGTIGEAQAARKLIEKEKCEILLNPAHEYLSYRDWMLQYLKDNNSPLMPTVHGGSIPGNIGGSPSEPIFRGAPMDSGQAVAALIKAQEMGAKRILLVATEIEGSQMQLEAALAAADKLGINIVDSFSVQPELASYRSEISRIANADPDALLIFSQSQDGGTIVKQASEAGMSLLIIGTTEWLGEGFPDSATEEALNHHEHVWISGFSYVDGPAYERYAPQWSNSKYVDLAPVENSYNIQYWDVLVVAALAIEEAGSTNADEWAAAVRKVAMGPGKKVYTYAEGLKAIRAGEDIDYTGCTGEFNYNDTGMVSGKYGIFEWQGGELVEVSDVDGKKVLQNDLY